MVKNHVNDDGDSTGGKLPVLAGNHLPSAEGQNPFYEFQEAEEIQLRDYLDVIMRRKWLILNGTHTGVSLYVSFHPGLYQNL